MRVALVAYDAEGEMSFGSHVDDAVHALPGGAGYVLVSLTPRYHDLLRQWCEL